MESLGEAPKELYGVERDLLTPGQPLTLPQSKEIPLKHGKDNFVLLHLANENRTPKSKVPAFQIIGFFGSNHEAENYARNTESFVKGTADQIIVKSHAPIVCSKDTDAPEEYTAAVLFELKDSKQLDMQRKKDQVHSRAEIARHVSTQNKQTILESFGESLDEQTLETLKTAPPDMPTLKEISPPQSSGEVVELDGEIVEDESQTGPVLSATASMTAALFGQRYSVVSILGADSPEPSLTIYASFDSEEDASAYAANVLSKSIDEDITLIGTGIWYRFDIFDKTVAGGTTYLDRGLNELMSIPQRNSAMKDKYKPYIEKMKEIEENEPVTDVAVN